MVGVVLVTVIDSDTLSSCSGPLTVMVAPASRVTPSTVRVWNPGSENTTR